jgi:anti-anti-sigma factor
MQGADTLSLRYEPGADPVVVRLVGEFDARSRRAFEACVERLLWQGHQAVLFDCASVRFRDVDALRCLITAHRLFHRLERSMTLANVPPSIEEILRVVTLHHPITILEGQNGSWS